ncbi:MAG: DMT family transporter [Pseudomonadota bacterium]
MNTPHQESTALPAQIGIGFLFAIASAALFAIRPILVKLVYAESVDPTTLILLRMAISMPIYLILLIYFLRTKPHRREALSPARVAIISVLGLFGYFIASFFDLIGLQYVSAQLGRLILYTYPTFTVVLGALFFMQKITARTVAAMLITYLGVAIIFGHDLKAMGQDVVTGSLWIIASAMSFAIYLLWSKSHIDKVGSQLFTCVALISASLGIFVYWGLTAAPTADLDVSTKAWIYISLIAIFCTVVPTFFTTAAVERIGPERTGIVAMIGPGFTSAFAVLMLSEAFTIYHLAGLMITIIGISFLPKK